MSETRERIDDHDDLRERVSKIEERLAAIERAATCGTERGEWSQDARFFVWGWDANDVIWFDSDRPEATDKDGNTWTLEKVLDKSGHGNEWHELVLKNSPAQSAVGEVSAVSGDQPPFRVGQVVRRKQAGSQGHKCGWVESITQRDTGRFSVAVRRPNDKLVHWNTEDLEAVPAGSEAHHNFGDPLSVLQRIRDLKRNCFRAIPPTAERESEPTPGMVAAANGVMYASGSHVAVDIIARHVSPELAELRAENERLKALDKDYCDSANKYAQEIGKLRQQLATATAERDEARAKLKKRTSEVETWLGVILQANEAIDGNVDEPEKLPGRVAKLVSQLATHREAAESLEALEGGKVTSVQQVVTGNRWFAACLGAIHFADTPTAAILAARDAAGTGEQK